MIRYSNGHSADGAITKTSVSRRAFALGVGTLALVGYGGSARQMPPRPPGQPLTGPGGRAYAFDGFSVYQGEFSAPTFRIFAPQSPNEDWEETAGPFPVIIFLPGCCEPMGTAMEPGSVRSWIEHLVRRGSVVVYAVYPILETDVIPALIDAALEELRLWEHVDVDFDRVTVAGYSAGGPAAVATVVDPPRGISPPRALLLMAPVDIPPGLVPRIPADTHVVVVQAERDPIVRHAPRLFWEALVNTGNVPAYRRSLVSLRSDDHGEPSLSGDHAFAATDGGTLGFPFSLDALDWYGTWKYLDAISGCAYEGEWCEYVFGNTPEQRYMGEWSDGTPVLEPLIDPSGT